MVMTRVGRCEPCCSRQVLQLLTRTGIWAATSASPVVICSRSGGRNIHSCITVFAHCCPPMSRRNRITTCVLIRFGYSGPVLSADQSMKLRQLVYINEVAQRNLTITAASDALHTSQPGVSKQIRMLEEELGV